MIIPLLKKDRPTNKGYVGSDGKKHYKKWSDRNKANSARKQESQDIYNTSQWHQLRNAAMLRDNGLCQRCLREFGRVEPAKQVHHIKPFLDYQGEERLTAAYDIDNTICLCDKCHWIVHTYPKQNKRYIVK